MKVSLGLGPRQTLSPQTAWGCLTTNLAVPGFGSLAAGRKVGYFQVVLGLAGLVLSLLFAVKFFAWYLTTGRNLQADPADPLEGLRQLWRAARWPLLGLAVFGVAWCWALITSLSILSDAKAHAARDIPPRLS